MFGILGPAEERRREPTLTGAPRLVSTNPLQLDPPERLAPIADREKVRWLGPIGSLVVHLLPLLLLVEWPMAAPPETEPIAVQLVLAPPPPEQPLKPVPPPSPVPPKPEFKPPPPGRIASEDLGDTEAKKAGREPSEAPPAKDIPPREVRPSETPQQTADVVPPPPPEEPQPPPSDTQTAALVPPPPPEKPEPPKPKPKPKPAAQQSLHWTEEPAHTAARPAKYPGPAATRDEYLAYVHSLIRQHYNLLPLSMVGGRRGEAEIEFVVLDDGTIGMIKVRQSSGWQDIDARVELMIAAVRRVPPLPQWFQGPSMALILHLPFPDALQE
ncbi:MAG TPA: TonB C-terminal domain-containing protein [Stellaceae bacterium]|nr:TonB C-terminal domain-containing protein [Stellaceae bacterium]